jgi:hypothetical protein
MCNITELTDKEKKQMISGKIRDTPVANWPLENRVLFLRRFMIKSEHKLALAIVKSLTYGGMQHMEKATQTATQLCDLQEAAITKAEETGR